MVIRLLKNQIGLQRAGRLDTLQDGDDAVGLDAEPVQAGNQRFQVRPVKQRDLAPGLAGRGLPVRQRADAD